MRTLSAADIPQAMLLKEAAGWNQTAQDWRNAITLADGGCFGIDCDGALAATTTAVSYGRDLAWIGMVLTHPSHRGRGFARMLMERAIEFLRDRSVGAIKLDATDMGRPLYKKLGFEDECPIERWGRAPEACDPAPLLADAELSLELDRAAFGADRSSLLHVLRNFGGVALEEGYAMGRPGSNAAYFGPCVVKPGADAAPLIHWFVARNTDRAIYLDLLPANREAVRAAQRFGFSPLRKLVRMAHRDSRPLEHDDDSVFAIAGFEYG